MPAISKSVNTPFKVVSPSHHSPSSHSLLQSAVTTDIDFVDSNDMDKLEYFDVRARAEPVRMLYGLSGTKYEDERVGNEAWEVRKTGSLLLLISSAIYFMKMVSLRVDIITTFVSELILGQLPVLHTADGMVNGSNTIARYVAKKLGKPLHLIDYRSILYVIHLTSSLRWKV